MPKRLTAPLKPTVGLLAALDGPYCQVCGTQDKLTVDHIAPKAHAKPKRLPVDFLGNARLACQPCNLRKGHRIPSPGDFPWGRISASEIPPLRALLRRYLSIWAVLGVAPEVLAFVRGDTDALPRL